MKRIAIIFTVISVAALILGLVEQVTNFRWGPNGDQQPFFGSNYLMRDGTAVLILGGVLSLAAILMWVLTTRRGGDDQRRS